MAPKHSLSENNVESEFESNLKKLKLSTNERTIEIRNFQDVQHYDHQDVICFFRDQLKLDKNRLESLNSKKKLDGPTLLVFINKFKSLLQTSTFDAVESASTILKPYFIDEEESNAAQTVGWLLVSFFRLDEENTSKEKILRPVPNTPETVEEYYEEAWRKWTGKQSFQEVTLEELDNAQKQNSNTLNYNILPLEKNEQFVKALPIKQENGKGQLAKHYLPFLPSLHISDTNDKKLENLSCSNVVVVSTSGMGKTSLMIRTLCKHAGLLITGTGKNEFGNGETVDESVRSMLNCFGSEEEAHVYVRQATLLLMIAKLFHILNLIDIAQKNPSVLETFEGDLLAFLAFNQFGVSNKYVTPIFDYLFMRFKDVNCNDLRCYTMYLIEKVKDLTSSPTFLICVDEANVLEENGFKFLSVKGNKRGLLSVFCNEIMKVNGKGLNIYAGTSFSINISDIVQANLGKKEGELKYTRLVEFEYLDSQAFIAYLKRHVIISDEIESFNQANFPLRIRQAALCLEYYINYILDGKRKSIEACLEETFVNLVTCLKTKAKRFIDTFPHFKKLYESYLFDYMIHHKFPVMCGPSFYVPVHDMAAHFLSSGIACPVSATLQGGNEQVEFSAVDVLGYRFAVNFVGRGEPISSEKLAQ